MPLRAERAAVAATVAVVFASRLAHHDIVWVEEAYGMAAAQQVLRGAALYRDVWFDKPPLYALYYALFAAQSGYPLRLAGSLLVLLTGLSAALAAARLFTRETAVPAFIFTCISLTFWIPSAVMAATPDTLALVPHFLAVAAAASGRSLLAGAAAGVALWCNSKGLIVLFITLLWSWRRPLPLLLGFSATQIAGLALLDVQSFWSQVWQWGLVYSRDTFVRDPWLESARRTAGWIWFHAALAASAAWFVIRQPTQRFRMLAWAALALAAVIAGLRFFPRYYFALLPPALMMAAAGWASLRKPGRVAVAALMLIPMIRFGPRYVDLLAGGGSGWSDLALMHDSRVAAEALRRLSRPTSDLLVWGYRPDVFVFSGLPAGTRYLDSQPLTGVLADRHIFDATPSFPEVAQRNRIALAAAKPPKFVVDGLGPLNPRLAITSYSDLQPLLSRYREVARTPHTIIYQLQDHSEK